MVVFLPIGCFCYNLFFGLNLGVYRAMMKFRVLGYFFLLICSYHGAAQDSKPNQVTITALDEGVWLHTSYYTYPSGTRFPSNGLIVKEGNSLTLIDTAWRVTHFRSSRSYTR